ncbi:MAG TPA: tRNA 2-thiouridine(34) synthase MnmA [Gammaproteobacteria bacterium]|nr:tRNA 2-thiouridine(34) synthase MnmA [Gammaproteobacteria bacterium]
MTAEPLTIVALSGGVDSAVAALLLRDAGHRVQCLHMTNWEDDGYCDNARELQDARRTCIELGLPLHRINFAREYRDQVFADFLAEHAAGRTPNPDVLCNRHIKFGVMRRYARRLGATAIATGHYARVVTVDGSPRLLKGVDPGKDQSYFLHAVAAEDLVDVLMPLGELLKSDVREIARRAGLAVAEKKDSTGICFIGERPFAEFLHRYLPDNPGRIRDDSGSERGRHRGLAYYTLGQRHGLNIGGAADRPENAWYVADKDVARNELVVVQGHDHPLLLRPGLAATGVHWIGAPPAAWAGGEALRCHAKIRYRQADQACTVVRTGPSTLEAHFDVPQRTPTPGQFVVLYDGDRCLGGATIERGLAAAANELRAAV